MSAIKLNDRESLSQIADIEQLCFHEPWSLDMLTSSFYNGCSYVAVWSDNKIVAYGGLYNTGDITNIAVLPDWRRQGLGGEIIAALIDIAREKGIDSIFLEVRESNIGAIKLYEKCGFKKISIRKRYYKDGENAMIYCLEV